MPIGYTVPSTITKEEKASIFFRVRRPIFGAMMTITSGGEELFRTKARDYKPSIMECLTVPAKILEKAQDEITLQFQFEEEGEK